MKKVFLAILFIVTVDVTAQFDAQISQYWTTKSYFNPAAAGSDGRAKASFLDRQQWVGMPGAPKSVCIGLDLPVTIFGKSQGVGITGFSDNIGLFNNESLTLDYAFRFNKLGGTFAIGAKFGFLSMGFDGSSSFWGDFKSGVYSKDDPAVPTTIVQANAMDLGFGAYYSKDKFYTGISVSHALNPTLDLDAKSTIFVGKIAYWTAGYEMPIEGSNIAILPSFLYKTDFFVSQLDLTLRGELDKKFWGGISYRWNNAVVLMFGARVNDISIGYSYDISTSKLFSVTSGSHEVFVNYSFDFVLQGKNQRKISKSVRYL